MKKLKLKRLIVNQTRRLSFIRVCMIFLFATFILTAYLYGLIEIDSHRLVINIAPIKAPENDYVLGEENLVIKINENIQINDAAKSSEIPNKNITNFFSKIERYKLRIKASLPRDEIDKMIELKQTYEKLIYDRHEKIKLELKKELDRINKENNEPNADENNDVNNDKGADDDDEDETKNLKVKTVLSADEHITRDLIVKFLKLEKHKRGSKQIKTVKELIDKFEPTDDFKANDLPDIWNKYFIHINELQLYNDTHHVNNVLKSISSLPVSVCNEKERGTQIKLLITLSDGTEVLVKPMKVPRDYETPPDHFYFVDFERHHAEIAAFHVDRLLGFNRVPPTVGRVFNMTTDLWEKAEPELAKTFFYSPAGNTCFTGHCSYYCDSTHAICGRPKDRMEGSVQLMLPSKPVVNWQISRHPYRRTYTKRKKAEWEVNDLFCEEKLFQDITFHSKLLLDIMDMSVFDFLIANMDRHHYEQMITLGNYSFPIHLDNGRSFGKIFQDEMSILSPLKQCCLIRHSTYQRLKYLYKHGFSEMLDKSLRIDPLYPVLTKNHLISVDRRLSIVFNELISCSQKFGPTQVIVDDGY